MADIMFDDDIGSLVNLLNSGGIILYPTDTIWGIGCQAYDTEAIRKIYVLKNRPLSKPLILLVDSIAMLKKHVEEIHPRIETLLTYHKRPLTMIYENPTNLPDILIAKENTVAIRVTTDPFCKYLIHRLGKPLVSTSANLSGKFPPACFTDVDEAIIKKVDYVVQHRQDDQTPAEPSVIARYNHKGELEFIRS